MDTKGKSEKVETGRSQSDISADIDRIVAERQAGLEAEDRVKCLEPNSEAGKEAKAKAISALDDRYQRLSSEITKLETELELAQIRDAAKVQEPTNLKVAEVS